MSTKYENYVTGSDYARPMDGVTRMSQSFTPATAHTIKSWKALLYRDGTLTTSTCYIYLADVNHKPTGAALCNSSAIDVSALTTNTAGAWIEYTLGAGAALSAGTEYCAVLTSAAFTGDLYWLMDTSASAYTGGIELVSTDSGATWGADWFGDGDTMFEEWGDPLALGRSFGHIIG